MKRTFTAFGVILICSFLIIPSAISTNYVYIQEENDEDIDWWIMAHHNSTGNPFSNSPAPSTNDIIWINDLQISTPVVYQNKLYGLNSDSLFCINDKEIKFNRG